MSKDEQILKALDKFENKIDKLDARLDSIEKVQVKQEANLGEHMRRTETAEENINLLREELKPVKKHVAYMEGALKGLGVVSLIVGVAAGIVKIFG